MEEIMNDNLITVHTMEDQEDVAHDFQKYDLTSMPVVDNENRLVSCFNHDSCCSLSNFDSYCNHC